MYQLDYNTRLDAQDHIQMSVFRGLCPRAKSTRFCVFSTKKEKKKKGV